MGTQKKSTQVLKWKHSSQWSAANADIKTLEKWAKLEISTKECVKILAANNNWANNISDSDFENSISQLGWNRGMVLRKNREFPIF